MAIVVPDFLKLKHKYKENNAVDSNSLESILQNEEVCNLVFDDIRAKLKESKLNSFEKPNRVFLAHTEMTVENDCLTPTLKVRRNFAVRMFVKEIQDL